jgi:hypothetical protein
MSVPLLVGLHARGTLRTYSTLAASYRNILSTAARISQTSNVRPLAIRFINTTSFPIKPPSVLVPPTRSAQFSILQFTQNTVWNATHYDRRIPAGGEKPPSGKPKISWVDTLPPPVIFWSILAINVGVYLAWSYAEGAAVSNVLTPSRFGIHPGNCGAANIERYKCL